VANLVPICFPCARSMRCAQNDFPVRDKRTATSPATVWLGDRFTCPDCNTSVVVSFGRGRCEDHDAPSDAMEFRR
jgi:hypothetical protein